MQTFLLDQTSPCIDRGTCLTVTRESGIGMSVQVDDARYFIDGFDLITGDGIQIGANPIVHIVEVDYEDDLLMVDQVISFDEGDTVSYPFEGSAPDMGAFEHVSSSSVGSLSGMTRVATTGVPLEQVMVTIGSLWALSDEHGEYQIDGIPAGIYKVSVRCDGYRQQVFSEVSIMEDIVTSLDVSLVENQVPSAPLQPTGPDSINVDVLASFTSAAVDPDGDRVSLGWDWDGDFIVDEYASVVESSAFVEMGHVWQEKGTVQVQVIALDEHGGMSDWSDPLIVQVSNRKSWMWSKIVYAVELVQGMWRIPFLET